MSTVNRLGPTNSSSQAGIDRIDIKRVIAALASYDHEADDERGYTWCRFCDGADNGYTYKPPVHSAGCVVLDARRLAKTRGLEWPDDD